MNNKNKILVGCLALLLVLSVGYALFSETVTINGTATAKGDFDITSNCSAGIKDELGISYEELRNIGLTSSASLIDVGYENDVCTVDGSKVSFSSNLLYPGAIRRFTVEFKNTGTIPAQIDADKGDDPFIYKSTREVCPVDENGVVSTECEGGLIWYRDDGTGEYSPMNLESIVAAKDINGNICKLTDECIMNYISPTDDTVILLQPGESFYYLFEVYWPSNYTSSTNSASYKLETTKEILFEQVTN